jgi:Anti-sigma factor NepR
VVCYARERFGRSAAGNVSGGGAVERSSVRKRKPAVKEKAPGQSDPAFDRWLDVRLKSLYGSALNEPIPEDMLKLLQQRPKSS